MTDPVMRWVAEPDGLADVVVREAAHADAVEVAAALLRGNPFAALAVVVAPECVTVRTEHGELVELTPARTGAPCLTAAEALSSAVRSLYAWHVARLDLKALRRNGLPVWCASHRVARSTVACGWLGVAVRFAEAPGRR